MGEKRSLFKKQIEYSGLVDVKDLHKVIQSFLTEKSYKYADPEYEETAKEDSRSFKIKMVFDTKPSDFAKNIFKVKYSGSGIKDVEVNRGNHKVLIQEGKVKIEIEGILETDYEDEWKINQSWLFLRTVFNRFFFAQEIEKDNKQLIDTGEALIKRIKSYLNLYQY